MTLPKEHGWAAAVGTRQHSFPPSLGLIVYPTLLLCHAGDSVKTIEISFPFRLQATTRLAARQQTLHPKQVCERIHKGLQVQGESIQANRRSLQADIPYYAETTYRGGAPGTTVFPIPVLNGPAGM